MSKLSSVKLLEKSRKSKLRPSIIFLIDSLGSSVVDVVSALVFIILSEILKCETSKSFLHNGH
tara:strand:+ start:988 stop:1176 length:189 start_codon:yes stop_codon:yes gene_type:complete